MQASEQNLILIGMPSCGKSTLGVLLAKRLMYQFLDTDLLIQEHVRMSLHAFQTSSGMEEFRQVEASVLKGVNCQRTVIATGGSAVYYPDAMAHLKASGQVLYLKVSLGTVQGRIGDLASRGVVGRESADLEELYAERLPLYAGYADYTIDCEGRSMAELVEHIRAELA